MITPTKCPVVTHSNQIKDLPWRGCFPVDVEIFEAIEAYINLPTTSMEEKKKALYGFSWYGMGCSEAVTNQTIIEYYMAYRDVHEWSEELLERYIQEVVTVNDPLVVSEPNQLEA